MRKILVVALSILYAAAFAPAKTKKVISPQTSAGNEEVDLVVTLSLAPEEVTQKIGLNPGADIVLLDVRVIPKTDKPVQVSPDDFILLAHDDGERSKPFTPSEIAGNGALIVTAHTEGKEKKSSTSGGLGGIMLGGGSGSPGNPRATTISTKADDKAKGDEKLLEALKAKQLPDKTVSEPLQGFLYFRLNGKHKLKDMAVLYRGPAGRLNLDFEH